MDGGEKSLLVKLREEKTREKRSEYKKMFVGLSDEFLKSVIKMEGIDPVYASSARDILLGREKARAKQRGEIIEDPIKRRD